ncbi:MAG: YfhO family protein [Bacteroidota bacterium]
MKNLNFKSAWPYLVAVIIFLVITMSFLSPMIEGKQILQSDIIHFKGAAKEIVDYREKTGQEPLWTNSMFGGMPAYQISTKYSGNLLEFVDKVLTLGLPHPANMVFLYFLGFFILLLVLGLNPWLSVAGAIAYAFSSYFMIIIEAGHNSQAHAIGYMAPVLAGMILAFRRQYLWGFILTSIALSLEVKQNHLQITYYLGLSAVILGLVELLYASGVAAAAREAYKDLGLKYQETMKKNFIFWFIFSFIIIPILLLKSGTALFFRNFHSKTLIPFLSSAGVLLIALVFAVLTNLTLLWVTYEYGNYTIRGKSELTSMKSNRTSGLDKSYATQWSYGIGETMTLLIADFYGGSSNDSPGMNSNVAKALRTNSIPEENIRSFATQPGMLYWGGQPWTSPVYVGAIVVFLFFLGLIIVKGPLKWWLLFATILSIMLAWGHNYMPLTNWFLDHFPGYNKFRAVTMILVMAELTMPLLGFLAIKVVFDGMLSKEQLSRGLYVAFGIAGGLTLVFALVPDMFLNFTSGQDASLAKSFPDWLMQAIRDDRKAVCRADAFRSFIYITLTAGTLWLVINKKLKKEYAYIGLIVFILGDMFTVAKRYLNNESFTSKSRVDTPFEPTPADQQILADKDPDYRVLNLTLNPMSDASTSYFHKSLGGYHGAKLRRYQELYDNHIEKQNMAVWNMLNTRYVIVPDENKQPMAQQNPNALGNAWFVSEYKIVDNADQELAALNGFNPSQTAVVDKKFNAEIGSWTGGKDTLDYIRLTQYQPNDLKYSFKSKNAGLAVFSEIYYPKGWNAYVDGTLTPHFRANYVLRAMMLPAGEHTVEFKFEPRAYYIGEKVSMISSVVLILIVLAGIAVGFKDLFATKA